MAKMQIERAIQKALIHWVMTAFCSKHILVSANFNEFAREHKDMGMDVGSPDLRFEATTNNATHILYLELKKKKGKLSKSQTDWNEKFDKHHASKNCVRCVAYGYNEAQKIISDWVKSL